MKGALESGDELAAEHAAEHFDWEKEGAAGGDPAGVVWSEAAGVWIANISRTHALYVEGEGYQVRLPRMEHDGEPGNGWFVHAGTALVVGSLGIFIAIMAAFIPLGAIGFVRETASAG